MGCVEPTLVGVRYDTVSVHSETLCTASRAKVDILIVVDGSASMAQEAEVLQDELRAIAGIYDGPRSGIDYRIAVIDSQVAQPGCDVTVEAGGRFVDTSCRQRLDAFVSNPSIEGDAANLRDTACRDACTLDELQTLPSPIAVDDSLRPRPWVEATFGIGNLPSGRSLADDLMCRVPVGIAGCPFEAPLEAMRLALARSDDPHDPAFGFLRDDAALFVMFIGDEPDCSFGEDVDAIARLFDPEGPRTYWSDPDAEAPTSGLCWNAGVACSDGVQGRECVAVDRAAPDSSSPVLRPVEDYVTLLQDIEASRRRVLPGLERAVFVSVLGGVPERGGPPRYPEALDPADIARFGTGPGCESSSGRAHPPVRLARLATEFAELAAWGETSLFPVCADSWFLALACVPGWDPFGSTQTCLDLPFADAVPETDELELDCAVDWTDPQGQRHPLSPCEMLGEVPRPEAGQPLCAHVQPPDPSRPGCEPTAGRLTFAFAEGVPRGCFHVDCEVETRTPGG
ncbi:MAG: hypothetical protein AB1Z98_22085, partial [Nannocystaceae bacterium]